MSQQPHDEVPVSPVKAALVQGLFVGSGNPVTATSIPPPLDNADQFTLTKPVNLTQLNDELNAALKTSVHLAPVGYDQTRDISPSNQAVLWVQPAGLDATIIQAVIDNHSPYAAYDVPKEDQAYSAVVQKVMADNSATLTDDEIQTALRGLLLRIETGSTTSASPSFPSGTPSTS